MATMSMEHGFLRRLLAYENIVIQCHDNPDSDALASGLAVCRYLQSKGKDAEFIYSGHKPIDKSNMKYMIHECQIPVHYIKNQEEIGIPDVLVTVDCQYGQANVTRFEAEHVMIIDHHLQVVEADENYLIKSDYQSCSTILYELLLEEGYDVQGDELLKIALYYGLYIDTSSFHDIYHPEDIEMKRRLDIKSPILTRLMNSTMNTAELMIACDALYNHSMNLENRFIIVSALQCDQSILGIIGDLVIQVDICLLCLTFSMSDMNYQFSIRCCNDAWKASEVAAFISKDIGSGGGHARKAGGKISKKTFESIYPGRNMEDYLDERLCAYIQEKKTKKEASSDL